MASQEEDFVDAADSFLAKIEASRLVSEKELEAIRRDLVRDVKAEVRKTVKGLQTTKVGAAKLVLPNSANLRKINLSTERVRTRMSSFRLSYLDRSQVGKLKADGTMTDDPKKFIRHSRRLARHAREFLTRIGELEPSLQEEIDATLLQLEDNDMDLLKLEVKSMTRMKETMLRAVNGRKERGQVLTEIDDWDLNKQLWNLSLLEHPDAVVRNIFANATEAMGKATTEKITEIAVRAHVFVGLPPEAAAAMTPSSRIADFAWRLFDTKALNEKFKALPGKQGSPSTWKGLGLDFGTREWYIPVPPRLVVGLTPIAVARRATAIATADLLASRQAAATVASRRAALARQEAKAREIAEQQDRIAQADREIAEEFDRLSEITTVPPPPL